MRIEGESADPRVVLAWDLVSDEFEVNGRRVPAEQLVTIPMGLVRQMMRNAMGDAINVIADESAGEVESIETTRFVYDSQGVITGKVVERPTVAGRISRHVYDRRQGKQSSAPPKRFIGFRSPNEARS